MMAEPRTDNFGDTPMTIKEKALSLIGALDDNATIDELIDSLHLLRKVEIGIAQADAGQVQEHTEFMAELEREHKDDRSVDTPSGPAASVL